MRTVFVLVLTLFPAAALADRSLNLKKFQDTCSRTSPGLKVEVTSFTGASALRQGLRRNLQRAQFFRIPAEWRHDYKYDVTYRVNDVGCRRLAVKDFQD